MTLKTRLTTLLQTMHDEHIQFYGRLNSAERTARGTLESWSAKDVVAHNGVWLASKLDEIQRLDRGEPLPQRDDAAEDTANAHYYAAYQESAWPDVLALIDDGYANIIAYVGESDEARLAAVSDFWGAPLWREIAGTYITHPMIHLWEYLLAHGRSDLIAERFGPAFAARLIALNEDPAWQGTATYNLACQYALVGEKAAALENLAQALRLNPDLGAWAAQDSDLDSLRQEAAYQALFP